MEKEFLFSKLSHGSLSDLHTDLFCIKSACTAFQFTFWSIISNDDDELGEEKKIYEARDQS